MCDLIVTLADPFPPTASFLEAPRLCPNPAGLSLRPVLREQTANM